VTGELALEPDDGERVANAERALELVRIGLGAERGKRRPGEASELAITRRERAEPDVHGQSIRAPDPLNRLCRPGRGSGVVIASVAGATS